jgi:hypothetical protein
MRYGILLLAAALTFTTTVYAWDVGYIMVSEQTDVIKVSVRPDGNIDLEINGDPLVLTPAESRSLSDILASQAFVGESRFNSTRKK